MKNFNQFPFSLSFLMLLLLIVSSCKKEEIAADPVVFYEDGNTILQFTSDGDDIEFFFDALNDLSDGRLGSFPNNDIFRLVIDYNNNGIIDSEVDLTIGILEDGAVCVSYIKDQQTLTPCEFFDDTSGTINFSSTENLEQAHMNYRVKVPKSIIAEGNQIKVIVSLHDSEEGWTEFPRNQVWFSNAFDIQW